MTQPGVAVRDIAARRGTARPAHVLITGVSPFEDLPGYQYAAMLREDPRYYLTLADDSTPALAVLRAAGAVIEYLPHPGPDETAFFAAVNALVATGGFAAVIPGTDAHLFALARATDRATWVRRLCPAAGWIADHGIRTKWDLQAWVSRYFQVPRRWRIDEPAPAALWRAAQDAPPVVVKGLRKGAVRCEHADEVTAACRFLLRNPANQGADGGLYLEEVIEGEEHCLLLIRLVDRTVSVDLRKLATTQSGTTLAAVIAYDQCDDAAVQAIGAAMIPGMALEVESRGVGVARRAFEVNVRFPSWVGALGAPGQALLAAALEAQLGREAALLPLPEPGTLLYRLPQSGVLGPEVTLSTRTGTARSLLWPTASPHQFLVK